MGAQALNNGRDISLGHDQVAAHVPEALCVELFEEQLRPFDRGARVAWLGDAMHELSQYLIDPRMIAGPGLSEPVDDAGVQLQVHANAVWGYRRLTCVVGSTTFLV